MLGDRLFVPPRGDAPGAATASRPVTAVEAARLAAVRRTDLRTGHAGVRVAIGTGAAAVHLTGWVDWRYPLVYVNRIGATAGPDDGLLQAVPGVVAVHPGRYRPPAGSPPVDPFPAPPVHAPATGWRVGPGVADPAVDTALSLLLGLRSAAVDDAARIAAAGARFVGTDEIEGVPVDMFDGPAVLPAGTAPATGTGAAAFVQGGRMRYWVDAHSRLLRAEMVVRPATLVRVDLTPADRTVPIAIELLGGAPVTPTRPTAGQLAKLARMRSRDYASGGGEVTIAVPEGPNDLVSARGWLDWRNGAAYLTLRNNAVPGPDDIWRVDAGGVTYQVPTGQPPALAPLAPPALPPPSIAWQYIAWADRVGRDGPDDLDTLLRTLLAQAAPGIDGRARLARTATRLRSDTVDGVPVTVYEIRARDETGVPAGLARMRYWVDGSGVLRRLEMRTAGGAYAYATVRPAAVPRLPDPLAG